MKVYPVKSLEQALADLQRLGGHVPPPPGANRWQAQRRGPGRCSLALSTPGFNTPDGADLKWS